MQINSLLSRCAVSCLCLCLCLVSVYVPVCASPLQEPLSEACMHACIHTCTGCVLSCVTLQSDCFTHGITASTPDVHTQLMKKREVLDRLRAALDNNAWSPAPSAQARAWLCNILRGERFWRPVKLAKVLHFAVKHGVVKLDEVRRELESCFCTTNSDRKHTSFAATFALFNTIMTDAYCRTFVSASQKEEGSRILKTLSLRSGEGTPFTCELLAFALSLFRSLKSRRPRPLAHFALIPFTLRICLLIQITYLRCRHGLALFPCPPRDPPLDRAVRTSI